MALWGCIGEGEEVGCGGSPRKSQVTLGGFPDEYGSKHFSRNVHLSKEIIFVKDYTSVPTGKASLGVVKINAKLFDTLT